MTALQPTDVEQPDLIEITSADLKRACMDAMYARVERSPFVLTESALDRSKGRDHRDLFFYAYGDGADMVQRLKDPRVSRSELDLHYAALLAEYATRDPELIAGVMAE